MLHINHEENYNDEDIRANIKRSGKRFQLDGFMRWSMLTSMSCTILYPCPRQLS